APLPAGRPLRRPARSAYTAGSTGSPGPCSPTAAAPVRAATLDAMSATLKAPADGFVSIFPETRFDALVVVSFGGPEGMDDVMPFLENVPRGRNVPRERLEEVAHHYQLFGGVSPINAQNRALVDALRLELDGN